MAFKLGDVIIDRIQYGYAESLDATNPVPLYTLSQLSDATINITAESTDVTDAQGNLVKKIWKSKSGEFTATNAFINTNLIAAASGVDPVFASEGDKIVMPKIITVKTGESVKLDGVVEGSVKMNDIDAGNLGVAYALADVADETHFAVGSDGTLALPTVEAGIVKEYIVRFDRDVTEGVKIQNTIDKFPTSCRLLLKALYYDPCSKNSLKSLYIEMPSFQISPETSIPVNTEGNMDFSGSLEIDYCGVDKVLYNIYFADDEE